jgi:hypothetical protein
MHVLAIELRIFAHLDARSQVEHRLLTALVLQPHVHSAYDFCYPRAWTALPLKRRAFAVQPHPKALQQAPYHSWRVPV